MHQRKNRKGKIEEKVPKSGLISLNRDEYLSELEKEE